MPTFAKVSLINKRYWREVAKCKREFPRMHYTRNYYIQRARHDRIVQLRSLGLRVSH